VHSTSFETLLNHRKDLKELQTKFSLSKTVIAVVGYTGAGKSSLINAVLDQPDILPTSGMRACTAVVVEVISNTENQNYEADITFLSQEV
jgi:predicted GTPase